MSSDASDPRASLRVAWRVTAVLLGTTIALAIGLAVALNRRVPGENEGQALQQALDDPRVRERVVAQLAERLTNVWDSHNDADVGRLLQPGLRDRRALGSTVSSNEWGLREEPFVLPKPAGLTRIVLLGDSLIFGEGVAAEERVGVFLRQFLEERSTAARGGIEVLHVGIGSWNIVAECAFLRRQLSLLQPDLVIHLTTSNDLDDSDGVRGFGSKAAFSPQKRAYADSRVVMNYPGFILGVGSTNNLVLGIDYEGRSRYERGSRCMLALREAVQRSGDRYLAWFHWGGLQDFTRIYLTKGLDDDEVLYNSRGFAGNRSYWVSDQDAHWNPSGMLRMAKLLYGAIQRRDLLPSLALTEWDEALEVLEEEHDTELRILEKPPRYDAWLSRQPIRRDFEVAQLSEGNAAQVNGGLDRQGRVSPYASFTLLNAPDGRLVPGTQLGLRGRGLGRPEIDGVKVQVYADEILVDTLAIPAEGPFDRTWPLPVGLDGRPFFSVRLIAEDYAYDEQNLQHCVVFELERIAVF